MINSEVIHNVIPGEFRIGRRRFTADGFSAASRTVIQFDGEFLNLHFRLMFSPLSINGSTHVSGCYYHGHNCCLPTNPTRAYLKAVKKRKLLTEYRDTYTREHGYQVVKILECEWKGVSFIFFLPQVPV